ncbi:TIGR03083 family protein [Pedococcus dokdonensis]|uniref:TIGR03083 family protein n=1 Tax=Pedococcus dokdonensis TaxID=443156 RepID=A0A1H0UI06_9MICO|nr:maleylpyruvate isomerase family mycothiol-dependent enzyme [Pedococcus dokdonensis]SDP65799.1 TIGR03083 family protein [Pedococcus dokdonensis]
MHTTLDFAALLALLDERSTAFREVVAAAPDLDVDVPSCPGWSLFDLAEHVGQGRRRWATIVAAGPCDERPAGTAPSESAPAPRDRAELETWLAAAVGEFDAALRAAGPEAGCWTWWGDSQSPETAEGVARHQVQELAVHTYDAQLAVGAPQPLPEAIALDGVEEFLSTCVSTDEVWPHEPLTLGFNATEGRAWRLDLSGDGARYARLGQEESVDVVSDAFVNATASDIVLWDYNRIALESLEISGDRVGFERLRDWDPDA